MGAGRAMLLQVSHNPPLQERACSVVQGPGLHKGPWRAPTVLLGPTVLPLGCRVIFAKLARLGRTVLQGLPVVAPARWARGAALPELLPPLVAPIAVQGIMEALLARRVRLLVVLHAWLEHIVHPRMLYQAPLVRSVQWGRIVAPLGQYQAVHAFHALREITAPFWGQ